jgi:hypothetical protein
MFKMTTNITITVIGTGASRRVEIVVPQDDPTVTLGEVVEREGLPANGGENVYRSDQEVLADDSKLEDGSTVVLSKPETNG